MESFFRRGIDRFETEERSVSVSEMRTQTLVGVGKYDDLTGLALRVGASVPTFLNPRSVGGGNLYIRNYKIDRMDGEMGRITVECVEAKSTNRPYHQTVDIDIAQVEKKLVNHPLMKDAKTQRQIRMFDQTEANMQFSDEGEPQTMYDLTTGDPLDAPVLLTDANAIKYAKAKLIGVDSYSVYLPVVTRVSQYLELPGVNVDQSDMSVSGTANPQGIGKLGEFDGGNVPIKISGFSGGLWFKNGDKFQQNANGSWTRTETWTYTNDKRTEWIYKDGAAKQDVTTDD